MLARVFENFASGIGRSLNSPSTLYIYPSILVPCARRPTPSLSHSLARGMLAHSSSTPVASQRFSRGRPATLRALSSTCVLRFLSFFFLSISFARFCFFSSFTLHLYLPFLIIYVHHLPFFLSFFLFFDLVSFWLSHCSLRKLSSGPFYKERSDEISFSISLFLSLSLSHCSAY